MANLQEIMARNQAAKAAEASGALPKHPSALEALKPMQGAIATGMQSVVAGADTKTAPLIPKQVFDPKLAEGSVGVYKDISLKQFVGHNNKMVRAVNGFFYAMADKDADLLEYYAGRRVVIKHEKK